MQRKCLRYPGKSSSAGVSPAVFAAPCGPKNRRRDAGATETPTFHRNTACSLSLFRRRENYSLGQRDNSHPEQVAAAYVKIVFARELQLPVTLHPEHGQACRN